MAIWLSTVAQFGTPSVQAEGDEFDALRVKWSDYLTGGTGYDTSDPDIAYKLSTTSVTSWSAMNKAANRTYLWSDLTNAASSSQITGAYGRLKAMALAYRTYGSSLYGNQDLKSDILTALDWMYVNRYNESRVITSNDNWWDLEIGTPLQLNDIVVLMYDDLIGTPAKIANYMNAVRHFSPDPTKVNFNQFVSTGANRAWMAMVVGLRGVLVKSESDVSAASDSLDPLFDYVTTGDGFYEDGSFIQHLVYAYNGSYGASLLQQITNVLYLLDGSEWENDSADLGNVYQWVYDSYEPFLYKGAMMDMTRGRSISRNYEQDHVVGHGILGTIARLSQMAPPSDAQRMKEMVKQGIASDTQFNFYRDVELSVVILAKAIMNDTGVLPRSELTMAKVFAGMDQALSLRPGYGFGVSLSSNRIGTFESTNGENLKGWYTGAGMTYLYNQDLQQYTDFWPTVNKYRLPGTTVDTLERDTDGSSGGYRSPNAWAGGSELLGQYAAAGMDLNGYGSTLTAKKSWFMFDDEVVALGAGINSFDERTVETTIENRMLNGTRSMQGIDPGSPAAEPIGSEPLRHKVAAVTDSGNDGNLPGNTFDNDLGTRWSSLGDGQWIQYDLGKTQSIGYVGMSFFSQHTRYAIFDILVSEDNITWTQAFSGHSSIVPTTDASQIQVFDFPDAQARYVRIVGHGHSNDANGFNSITEVQIYAPSQGGNLLIPNTVAPLYAVTISDSQGSSDVGAVKDEDIGTSWTSEGDEQWLKIDLGGEKPIGYAGIGFPEGKERSYSFDLLASSDDSVWNAVYSGFVSAPTSEVTAYDFADTAARYVKLVFHGNDIDLANEVSEVQLYSPSALGPVLNPIHAAVRAKGDEKLIVNGVAKTPALGWTETMNGVNHAHLEGTGGYYFPVPATIKGSRAASQGSWSELNTAGPAATLTKNYLALWYDHGAAPVMEDYAYVLLPGKSAAETAAYSANPNTEILVNHANVQAVREISQNVIGANFWAPGSFGFLTASNPSSLMLKDQSGALDVAVSDPTHLQDKVTFEIHKSGLSVLSKDDSVTVLQLSPTIKFEVDTEAKDGVTHTVKFEYDPDATVPLPTPTPAPEPPAAPDPSHLIDGLDDFSHVFARSANMTFDRGNPDSFGGDMARAIRKNTQSGYLIYKSEPGMDFKQFNVKAWMSKFEAATELKLSYSADGVNYFPYSPLKSAGTGNWYAADYSGSLPRGSQYLKIEYAQTNQSWHPQIGKVEITSEPAVPTSAIVTDELNDFTKIHAHSPNLFFNTSNASYFDGDASRLARTTDTNEYVVYKAADGMDLKEFSAKTWFWPYETMDDYQFFTSPDNTTYTPFTPQKTTITDRWNEVDYTGSLPAGTRYLKIVFAHSTTNTWNPQIGSVTTKSVLTETATDPLNDFTKIFARSANFQFDSTNPAYFEGDTSRLQRSKNQNEFIVYKAAFGMSLKQYAIRTWIYPGEASGEFQLYASTDNSTYTAVTPAKTTTISNWHKAVLAGTLPAGTQYLKIVYPTSATYYWHPQISEIVLTSQGNL